MAQAILHNITPVAKCCILVRLDSSMVGYDDIGMALSSSQLGLEISEDSDWTSPNGLVENPGTKKPRALVSVNGMTLIKLFACIIIVTRYWS